MLLTNHYIHLRLRFKKVQDDIIESIVCIFEYLLICSDGFTYHLNRKQRLYTQ